MSNIDKTVASINKPEISPVVKDLSIEKSTPAYEIINYFYTLDTSEKFQKRNKDQLAELLEKYDKKEHAFLHRIISIRTQRYLNTHYVDGLLYQSVSSALGVDPKPRLLPKKAKKASNK